MSTLAGTAGSSLPDAGSPGAAEVVETVLARAGERGRAEGIGYAGQVTAHEAWRLLSEGAAVIVDVRTLPEWEYVGHVPGATLIEWRRYGEQQPNADFLTQLQARFKPDVAILFLCRSGVRSHHAAEAATAAGYSRAFNILEGFEGALDGNGQRGTLGGWRHAGLPWRQG
jgi:rhodanese-related sulfurtransferase